MDTVFLRDLRIETVIGVWEWERHTRQTIVLDLDMATDVRRAAANDAIDDALNYAEVAQKLIEHVGASRFNLVETLAESVARIVVQDFRVEWVRVRVGKPYAVAGSKEVGVLIERRTSDYA